MPRRVLRGTVVSDKGDKTVVVKVEGKVMHPCIRSLSAGPSVITLMTREHAENRRRGQNWECRPILSAKWEIVTGDA